MHTRLQPLARSFAPPRRQAAISEKALGGLKNPVRTYRLTIAIRDGDETSPNPINNRLINSQTIAYHLSIQSNDKW